MFRIILSSILAVTFVFLLQGESIADTDLKLNSDLDYNSDSDDGPLITGKNMSNGTVEKGKPAYVIFYSRECYNSKRQARRTVELYEKYKDRVDFVVVDLDSGLSVEQKELKSRYYSGYIPHVTIIDNSKAVYDRSGEIGIDKISSLLDGALK